MSRSKRKTRSGCRTGAVCFTGKELTYDEVEEQVEKNVFSYDLSEMDWAEYLTHFTYIVAGIGKYRDEINGKLSDIDKKNWISFARQQAEFYRNAEQYITNIQFNIDEIDDKIEEILLKTEDANYNVTQGYKVFKRLKELRIERKEKEKELDCLYALTDTIDCPSLAGVCEESLAEIEDIMDVQLQNNSADISEVTNEQEEIHVVKNINEMAG